MMLWIIVGQNMINIMNHVLLEMLCSHPLHRTHFSHYVPSHQLGVARRLHEQSTNHISLIKQA